jgi:NAD+ kinase
LFTELQISRVLVVYKKSYYELYGYQERARYRALLQQRHPAIVHTMRLSHEENQRTLAAVCEALGAVQVPYDCVYRGDLKSVAGYDLLLSVGGDGTFLEVARYTVDTPVLGVNSDPQRSTAFFCAAERLNIQQRLKALLTGRLPKVRLARLQASINGAPLPYLALNDLLVAQANPAAVTSYTLHLGAVSEVQKSSGVWIATAAGSTAAIRAAGGRIIPLRSRKLQYLIREPYFGDGCHYRLLKGLVPPDTPLTLTSRTRRGRLFMDGPHLRFPLGLGDVLTVTTAATPLCVVGLDGVRRQRF